MREGIHMYVHSYLLSSRGGQLHAWASVHAFVCWVRVRGLGCAHVGGLGASEVGWHVGLVGGVSILGQVSTQIQQYRVH